MHARLVAALLVAPALAAGAPRDPVQAAPGPGTPAAVTAAQDVVSAEVQSLVSEATHQLAAGNARGAVARLRQARALLPPGSWVAPVLDDLVQSAELQGGFRPAAEPLDAASSEDIAEMYAGLLVFGFWTGGWLFGVVTTPEANVAVPLSVVMAGGGALTGYLIEHNAAPLRGGTAAAINLGLVMGTLEAILAVGSNPNGFNNDNGKVFPTAIWLGGAVGGIAAGTIAQGTGATRGGVSLASSGGIWGAGLGAAFTAATDPQQGQTVAQGALVGSLLGLSSMIAVASQTTTISRTRVLFIDLGGLGGGLVGVGVVAAANMQGPAAFGVTGAAAVAGLVTATLLTQGMDARVATGDTPVALAPLALPAAARAPAAGGLAIAVSF